MGRQQRNTDYLAAPVGQGTSYFLCPGANLSPEQTDDAAIGVERRLDGCVVEIPGSFKFQPEPPNQPTSRLIPILNEGHCMKANCTHSKTFYWSQFYQIAQSLGLFRVAACRAQAWSQLARKKAGCLVSAQALLLNHLMNAPRKPFTGGDPEKPKPSKSMIPLFPLLLVNADPVVSGFFVSTPGKSREVTARVLSLCRPRP